MINKRTILAAAMALTLGTGAVQAIQVLPPGFGPIVSVHGNFTVLTPSGAMQGGTNDVQFSWDGTVFTDSTDYSGPDTSTANMFASSDEPFSGNNWTLHDVQVFAPGSTYTFDTVEGGIYRVSLAANQVLVHMLFDWGASANIDVVLIVEQGGVFGSGQGYWENGAGGPGALCSNSDSNCLWDGDDDGIYYAPGTVADGVLPDSNNDGLPDGGVVWDVVSVDGAYETSMDGGITWVAHAADGIPGIPMIDGAFSGFNVNFNFNVVVSGPDIRASIDITDGVIQECTSPEGTAVSLVADIILLGDAELDSIQWTVDGNDAGAGLAITPVIDLGIHTIALTAMTTSGLIASPTTTVEIRDTTAPVVNASFINKNTGETVTGNVTQRDQVTTYHSAAVDVCDPDPAVNAVLGISVDNESDIGVFASQESVLLKTGEAINELEYSVTASDASGNTASSNSVISIQ